MERYLRQMIIPGWGEEGQEKIAAATVFIAGAGGLGSPVAYYLAAAGVGTVRLCDNGEIETSNLNRQVLYGDRDNGKAKAETAAERLRGLNGSIEVIPLAGRIEDSAAAGLVGDADLMIDCLDNFETRYVLNRLSVARGIPLIHAGVAEFSGQMTFLHPPETPCLSCIFPEVPAQGTIPIAGPTAGVMGALEAVEALKYLTGIGRGLRNRLLIWSGEEQTFDTVEIARDDNCPVCGRQKADNNKPRSMK